MKMKSFILVCVLFALVLLVSSTTQAVESSKDESTNAEDKAPEVYHVNDGYGRGNGGWGGYSGGNGGWGGYGGGGYGGPGGGYGGGGWGGRGGGNWGGRGGGGWGGGGGGWGRGGCRWGCCGRWYRYRGCSSCCRSLTDAIAFNEHEATP